MNNSIDGVSQISHKSDTINGVITAPVPSKVCSACYVTFYIRSIRKLRNLHYPKLSSISPSHKSILEKQQQASNNTNNDSEHEQTNTESGTTAPNLEPLIVVGGRGGIHYHNPIHSHDVSISASNTLSSRMHNSSNGSRKQSTFGGRSTVSGGGFWGANSVPPAVLRMLKHAPGRVFYLPRNNTFTFAPSEALMVIKEVLVCVTANKVVEEKVADFISEELESLIRYLKVSSLDHEMTLLRYRLHKYCGDLIQSILQSAPKVLLIKNNRKMFIDTLSAIFALLGVITNCCLSFWNPDFTVQTGLLPDQCEGVASRVVEHLVGVGDFKLKKHKFKKRFHTADDDIENQGHDNTDHVGDENEEEEEDDDEDDDEENKKKKKKKKKENKKNSESSTVANSKHDDEVQPSPVAGDSDQRRSSTLTGAVAANTDNTPTGSAGDKKTTPAGSRSSSAGGKNAPGRAEALTELERAKQELEEKRAKRREERQLKEEMKEKLAKMNAKKVLKLSKEIVTPAVLLTTLESCVGDLTAMKIKNKTPSKNDKHRSQAATDKEDKITNSNHDTSTVPPLAVASSVVDNEPAKTATPKATSTNVPMNETKSINDTTNTDSAITQLDQCIHQLLANEVLTTNNTSTFLSEINYDMKKRHAILGRQLQLFVLGNARVIETTEAVGMFEKGIANGELSDNAVKSGMSDDPFAVSVIPMVMEELLPQVSVVLSIDIFCCDIIIQLYFTVSYVIVMNSIYFIIFSLIATMHSILIILLLIFFYFS